MVNLIKFVVIFELIFVVGSIGSCVAEHIKEVKELKEQKIR